MRRQSSGKGPAAVSENRAGGACAVWAGMLFADVSGLYAHLWAGRRRDDRGGRPSGGGLLGRCDEDPCPAGRVRAGNGAVRLRKRSASRTAVSESAAVFHMEAGAGESLRRVAPARDAVFDGNFDENLPDDRRELGAGGQCALRCGLPAKGGSGRPCGSSRADGARMDGSNAGRALRVGA